MIFLLFFLAIATLLNHSAKFNKLSEILGTIGYISGSSLKSTVDLNHKA